MLGERFAVIGDVHGNATRLRSLLMDCRLRGRHLVFTGDLIGRGDDSKGVIELVSSLPQPTTTALLGNHELALLNFLDNSSFPDFFRAGGGPVIRSYVGVARGDVADQLRGAIPEAHLRFLRQMPTFLETDRYFVSHVGINPQNPESRTLDDVVLVAHPELFRTGWDYHRLVICGHYAQRGHAFISRKFICVDSGCGTNSTSPLTAILLPELSAIES